MNNSVDTSIRTFNESCLRYRFTDKCGHLITMNISVIEDEWLGRSLQPRVRWQITELRTQIQKTETYFYNIYSSFSSLFTCKNMTVFINYPNICNSYYFYNHIRYQG